VTQPAMLPLLEVDEVKITVLIDNVIDALLGSTPIARRMTLGPNPFECGQPIAQHGFSVLLEVKRGERSGTVLFDTGVSRTGILHNADALEIDLGGIQAIILPTVEALQAIGPTYIVPGHCTGWVATHMIARTMPEAFIPNSVGTTFTL